MTYTFKVRLQGLFAIIYNYLTAESQAVKPGECRHCTYPSYPLDPRSSEPRNGLQTCYDTAYTIEPEALLAILRTNTIEPAHLSRVLLPLLECGHTKRILHISSTTGSIASGGADPVVDGRYTAYAMSKAALNMFVSVGIPELLVWRDG